MKQRICTKCQKQKPLSEFCKDKRRKDGIYPRCKSCTNEYKRNKGYYKTARQKHQSLKGHLKRNYGLTLKEFDRLAELQGNVCLICKEPATVHPRLSVDHNHVTGKIRGLLCHKCNVMLGFIERKPEVLENLIDYLLGE